MAHPSRPNAVGPGAVTTRPEGGGPHGGQGTDLPRDGQLELGTKILDAYEEEARRLLKRLHLALTSGGRSINDAAEDLRIDGALLTRILGGHGANIPPRLLVYALWRDRTHDLARHLADLAGGEWKPKPPPDAAYWLPLVREDLERRGLWELVAESVGFHEAPEEP